MLTDNVFELKRIGIEMMIDWTVWQPSILFTMNNLWNILFIIGAIAHCILCIVMIPLEGNVTGVKAIFAFETIMNLNTIISIFVRAQMILAATSGSFCSIAIGWAMLKTGGANVGVLAADHQRFYELFKLLQVTKQNRIRLFCVGGILLFIIVGLEGIILQQTLRDGLPSIYPFESTISIPTTIIPNDRNYLFSDVMGQPISYTGIGAGIGLKSLTDVSLRIDNKTNNVLPRIGPEPVPLVRCSSSATDCQSEFSMPMDLSIDCQQTTTKSTATDDSGTFVESMLGNSAPPTTTWIITKSNQDINVTHTCTITAGKSIWFDNRNGTMQKKSFESYTKVTEGIPDGPSFIASGMMGCLVRSLQGKCAGNVKGSAAPLVCGAGLAAMTNTIDRDTKPGIGTEQEMKYIVERLTRRLTSQIFTFKSIKCTFCEFRTYRYVTDSFILINLTINLIIIIMSIIPILIRYSIGPISDCDLVTIIKLSRCLNEKDLEDDELASKVFYLDGRRDEEHFKIK